MCRFIVRLLSWQQTYMWPYTSARKRRETKTEFCTKQTIPLVNIHLFGHYYSLSYSHPHISIRSTLECIFAQNEECRFVSPISTLHLVALRLSLNGQYEEGGWLQQPLTILIYILLLLRENWKKIWIYPDLRPALTCSLLPQILVIDSWYRGRSMANKTKCNILGSKNVFFSYTSIFHITKNKMKPVCIFGLIIINIHSWREKKNLLMP